MPFRKKVYAFFLKGNSLPKALTQTVKINDNGTERKRPHHGSPA